MVISLAILTAVIPSLFFITNTCQHQLKRLGGQHRLQMESIHFMNFVQNELKQGHHFRHEGANLLFDLYSGDTIRYEWKDRQVVRKVKKRDTTSFQGRTVLAYDVYMVTFIPHPDRVRIDIGFQNWYSRLDLGTTIMARERRLIDDSR